MIKSLKISNGKIVTPEKIVTGDLIIENGIISEIISTQRNVTADKEIDVAGSYVLPGFIDIHTNGAAGFDCTFGTYDKSQNNFKFGKEDYFSGLEKALRFYLSTGCTTAVLSTISAPFLQVWQTLSFINEFKKENRVYNDCLFGIMIEGSFIKDSECKGAHNPEFFQSPTREIIDELLAVGNGLVKIVNLPPEWGDDSFNATEYLKERNIISAVGHTAADAENIKKAVEKGVNLAIHLFNGPSSASFKPFGNGGAVEEVLRNDSIYAEVIVDGIHVDKSYILDAIARKGADKIIAITDSMFVTGDEDLAEFKIGGKTGCVSEDKNYLYVKEKPKALFGSNLSMDKAFENLLNWFSKDIEGIWNRIHPAKELNEAVILASKLCSGNAAALLGINNETGTIEIGKKADLLIGNITEKENYKFELNQVVLRGKIPNLTRKAAN